MVMAFEACIAEGGVAVFPADTVYGLACDPEDEAAVGRLYELKGRAPDKPAAVMFFDIGRALDTLDDLGPRTRAAVRALLPGGVTLLLPNPRRRFPLACTGDPETLGVRVPADGPLRGARVAVLQSSANHAGEPAPRSLGEVPEDIRQGVHLALDAGELPGIASTVVDLRGFEDGGGWAVAREGAVGAAELEAALGAPA